MSGIETLTKGAAFVAASELLAHWVAEELNRVKDGTFSVFLYYDGETGQYKVVAPFSENAPKHLLAEVPANANWIITADEEGEFFVTGNADVLNSPAAPGLVSQYLVLDSRNNGEPVGEVFGLPNLAQAIRPEELHLHQDSTHGLVATYYYFVNNPDNNGFETVYVSEQVTGENKVAQEVAHDARPPIVHNQAYGVIVNGLNYQNEAGESVASVQMIDVKTGEQLEVAFPSTATFRSVEILDSDTVAVVWLNKNEQGERVTHIDTVDLVTGQKQEWYSRSDNSQDGWSFGRAYKNQEGTLLLTFHKDGQEQVVRLDRDGSYHVIDTHSTPLQAIDTDPSPDGLYTAKLSTTPDGLSYRLQVINHITDEVTFEQVGSGDYIWMQMQSLEGSSPGLIPGLALVLYGLFFFLSARRYRKK